MIINDIKKRMEERHITQNEMAVRIGVTTVTMSRWFTGKRYPASNFLEAMARELDCDLTIKECVNE